MKYTFVVIPEHSTHAPYQISFSSKAIKLFTVFGALTLALLGVFISNYLFVMSHIQENKDLRVENRKLKQQVQLYHSRFIAIDSTLDRVKLLANRLKIITNSEDPGGSAALMRSLPDAATNTGLNPENKNSPMTESIAESLSPRDPERQSLEDHYQLVDQTLKQTASALLNSEQELQLLYETMQDKKDFLSALPTIKPAEGLFTSGFGVRRSPFGESEKMHEGLDIANSPGTPIRAPANGIVSFASSKTGYGQMVILDHGYGIETWYGHTSRLLVSSGQKIRRGETIALLGNSGRSTGPHLHYEVRVNGTPVDPLTYILEN